MTTTSHTPGTNRTKQFKRQPKIVPPIAVWTERDHAIIEAIARYRFASAENIHQIVGGSYRKVQGRLQQMFHHGFLDRPPRQINLWDKGRQPYIYALGDQGAKLLRRKGVDIIGHDKPRYWHQKNVKATGAHLHHTAMTTAFAIYLQTACKEKGIDCTWTREGREIQDKIDLPQQYIHRPGKKRLRLKARKRASINPDGMAHFHWRAGLRNRNLRAFVELDTGTEPNVRETSYGTDIATKMRAFVAWAQAKRHRERFDIPGFLVLFATTAGEKRIENILATARAIDPKGVGLNMFWATQFTIKTKPASLLEEIWKAPNGKSRSLLG